MKRFKEIIMTIFRPGTAIWMVPVALTVPNILLDITEAYGPAAWISNFLLPYGIYLLLMAASPKIGRTTLFLLPLMALAAFQLVLTSLYHGSVIGVDMFLNVLTTNKAEVMELLGNLVIPMSIVILIYAPLITWGFVAYRRRSRTTRQTIRTARIAGTLCSAAGAIALSVAAAFDQGYHIDEDLFPVNALKNMAIAVERTKLTTAYPTTSAHYTYGAIPTHDSSRKELYILVIGETARADNFQLLGYDRPTNPKLSGTEGIISFGRALSESNTTHKSVPMLLSTLRAADYDSIYYRKSVISAFREAGFATAFLSMQRFNHSFIDFFAQEADTTDFIRERKAYTPDLFDGALIQEATNVYKALNAPKTLLVLHSYGSHFNYTDRYPADMAKFTPDRIRDAKASERQTLINAYDNSILYTDSLIAGLIGAMEALADVDCALIYTSDHGEDIFDDERKRFLHASPVPTYWQLHVPLIIWTNGAYRAEYPELCSAISSNSTQRVSTSASLSPTLLDIAGIRIPGMLTLKSLSLASRHYRPEGSVFLNDRNQAVSLMEAGLTDTDFALIERMGTKR